MTSVRLRKRHIEMDYYSQDPLDPHPTFPQWSSWSVYPHEFYGNMQRRVIRHKFYMPRLENEFLRVTIAADIGGRIWDIYDKLGKRHVISFNPAVQPYNAGFGRHYVCGGIECNYPLAHSCTTGRQREVSTLRNPDGSASVIISEYDRIWRTRWSVAYTLYPGRSFLELRVRLYNRTPHDSRYMYWNNCGFYINETTEFIYPETAASMHGAEVKTFSWPLWRHNRLSLFRETPPEPLGLYMLDAREPYFGYYDHGDDFGLVHYGDLADLPGKKYWTWGSSPALLEEYRKTHSNVNEVYAEIQSGRIVIQEHLDRVPPETECEWAEIWYPVRGTGAFNGAGPGAALAAEVITRGRSRSRIRVKAMGNGSFPKARVVVCSDRMTPVERAMPLDPNRATERILDVGGRAGPDHRTTIALRNEDGEILATCRLRRPNKRDSWREVVDLQKPIEPVGVEALFRAAEDTARDWGNHDLQPLYEKVVRQDDGFSPARRELGKLATWKGLYDEAIEHFEVARRRDPDSLDLYYFHGVALMYAGRTEEARKAFEMANRYDGEARSLVRLAELRMKERDWHHALKHLDRLADAYPRLTRPRGLRAACLRKLGRKSDAAQEIEHALRIDGQDPFLRLERMFISSRSTSAKKLPARSRKSLIEQVRGYEPPLLETAFDYLSVGLHEEAEAVTRIIPNPGPLAMFVTAYCVENLGRRGAATRILHRGCGLDVAYHHPWRLEMIPILEWARRKLPAESRPALLLGNLLVARRRLADGVTLWRQAEKLGEKHYLLFDQLGTYEAKFGRNRKRAFEYAKKAIQAAPRDLYMIMKFSGAMVSAGKQDEAIRCLEKNRKAVLKSPRLAHALLNMYLSRDAYDKFDALCKQVDFSVNWQIPGPHSLWITRHFKEALQRIQAGELRSALGILQNLGKSPANLGVHQCRAVEDDRRYYHIGCIHEKMRDMEAARKSWEEALAVPHYTGYEPAYWFSAWRQRYFQALSLQKLGRHSEANALFDAMELLAQSDEIPFKAKESILGLVERGRFAPEDQKDPTGAAVAEVATKAEL